MAILEQQIQEGFHADVSGGGESRHSRSAVWSK
jgi:hypothetical protein